MVSIDSHLLSLLIFTEALRYSFHQQFLCQTSGKFANRENSLKIRHVGSMR